MERRRKLFVDLNIFYSTEGARIDRKSKQKGADGVEIRLCFEHLHIAIFIIGVTELQCAKNHLYRKLISFRLKSGTASTQSN